MAEFGFDTVLALVGGALLAGAGRIVSDWWYAHQTRISYLTAIKTETNVLIELVESQQIRDWCAQTVKQCDQGNMPPRIPTFDFHNNYFSCFELLGDNIRFLDAEQCKSVVEFYMILKAGFDTIRKGGPLSNSDDVQTLRQRCLFLQSLIQRCIVLNNQIQGFPTKKWWIR
jgi:hypothetical protein